MRRVAVIMAGGSGERFWPLSRWLRPKQLLPLSGTGRTMIQDTVDRLLGPFDPSDIVVATAPHLVEPIAAQLPELPSANILAEPHKRNTAGCLVWIAAGLLAEDPGARATTSMAVVASDHQIEPAAGFQRTVATALDAAEAGRGLGTIGIAPDRAETGYGYIEVDPSTWSGAPRVGRVAAFREKPSQEDAERYVASGRCLWNSGMFFWTVDGFLSELERVAPDLADATMAIADLLRQGEREAAERRFAEVRSISIDYALMEQASEVFVVEADFQWDDLGAWDALPRSKGVDDHGNVLEGGIVALDTRDSVVVNASADVVACLMGVEGLAVVVTDDAVLVCPKHRAQEVRRIVEKLREQGIDRAR